MSSALQHVSLLLHQALAWGNHPGPAVLHSNRSTPVSCSSAQQHSKGSSNR